MKNQTHTLAEVILNPKEHSSRWVDRQEEKRTTLDFSNEEIVGLKRRFVQIADEIVKKSNPKRNFSIDDNNKEVLDGLFWWFWGDSRSCYDTSKGLLLIGNKGTGKTTLLHAFRKFFLSLGHGGFRMDTAINLSRKYAQDGNVDEWIRNEIAAIDEIGLENMGKHYGSDMNVIAYILHNRYSIWTKTGTVTIATSNEDSEGIEALYGEVIRDRVKEMFNIIPLVGESRRNN